MLGWERQWERSVGSSHPKVSGLCSETNGEPRKLAEALRPPVLLAGPWHYLDSLKGAHHPPLGPSPPHASPVLSPDAVVRTREQGGEEAGPPSLWQPFEMSQLTAANVENAHCLMHRCENWRRCEPEPP